MRLPIYPDVAARLPTLAGRWLEAVLPGPLPAEPHATCDDCAMAPPEGVEHQPGGAYFDPGYKCCTFVPTLPNYAAGGALAGPGAARVEARLARRLGLFPLGLTETPREALLAREGPSGFGHSRALVCPYLTEASGCAIWEQRNAICATWFCRHARGEVSERLWRAVKLYLSAAERVVALHCALSLDLGDEALALLAWPAPLATRGALDAHSLDDRADPARARARWGRWFGQEREFYAACAAESAGVDAARLRQLGGVSLDLLGRALQIAWRGASDTALPPRLRLGALRVLSFEGAHATVEGYSPYDLLDLPRALLEVLPFFDGASVDEARARALTERRLKVSSSLVRKLLDFGILVAE